MKANYGYLDGSGQFFITIDTDKCAVCEHNACIAACPEQLFGVETDDYDERAAFIREDVRHQIKYKCAACKPVNNRQPLLCVEACSYGAIVHSW